VGWGQGTCGGEEEAEGHGLLGARHFGSLGRDRYGALDSRFARCIHRRGNLALIVE